MERWYQTTNIYKSFKGKPGEANVLFALSADIFGLERPSTAWLSPMSWENQLETAKAAVNFMCAQNSPSDAKVWFDGRSREIRRRIEERLDEEQPRHLCEIWVVYQDSKKFGRRVPFASDTRETGWISFPVARNLLSVKNRKDFSGAGENSSRFASFAGVAPIQWSSLPFVSLEDKASIMKQSADAPDRRQFDSSNGVPLYWHERKPKSFWENVVKLLDAKAIVDLSPGTGGLARVAMALGISYQARARIAPPHPSK